MLQAFEEASLLIVTLVGNIQCMSACRKEASYSSLPSSSHDILYSIHMAFLLESLQVSG